MKSKTIIIIVIAVALALTLFLAYLSSELFKTSNFISAFFGYAAVRYTDTEYVEIDRSPLTVITYGWDKAALDKYMMENGGYTEIPDSQMGHVLSYENDNYRVSVHSYWEHSLDYIVWEINDPKAKQD